MSKLCESGLRLGHSRAVAHDCARFRSGCSGWKCVDLGKSNATLDSVCFSSVGSLRVEGRRRWLGEPVSHRLCILKTGVGSKDDDVARSCVVRASSSKSAIQESSERQNWNEITEKLTALSSLVGIVMMIPQIYKNFQNLSSNQFSNLSILPWESYTSGLLGNLLLLSYFVSKKETSATFVQVVGSLSTSILLSQIFIAGYMPPLVFYCVLLLFVSSFVINYVRYFDLLPETLWKAWQSFSSVVGIAILPQVFCLTFDITKSFVPFFVFGFIGISCSLLVRFRIFPTSFETFWATLSAWCATLLFMVMPIPQLKACITNPSSLIGLSFLSPLLSMSANALMIPRALFIRDFMWLTGCTWGSSLMGWSVLLFMALNQAMDVRIFSIVTFFYALYLICILLKDVSVRSN